MESSSGWSQLCCLLLFNDLFQGLCFGENFSLSTSMLPTRPFLYSSSFLFRQTYGVPGSFNFSACHSSDDCCWPARSFWVEWSSWPSSVWRWYFSHGNRCKTLLYCRKPIWWLLLVVVPSKDGVKCYPNLPESHCFRLRCTTSSPPKQPNYLDFLQIWSLFFYVRRS